MRITEFELPGLLLIEPSVHADSRGRFSEVFRADRLAEAGFTTPFVQDNQSFSKSRGTVRGMHFQAPPRAQAKLVRVVCGAIIDVAIDLRRGSPTYGKAAAVELSAENRRQLLLPKGFAHGLCTLSDDTEVLYKLTDTYAPQHEAGVVWSDPDLGVDWPVRIEDAVLTERDAKWPRLAEMVSPFD